MDNEFVWYTELSKEFLERDYLIPGQTLTQRADIITNRFAELCRDKELAAEFLCNLKKGWYSLSTPVWTNYGTERGLPISCFGTYVEDSIESILHAQAEMGMMTKHGGGTSAWFGEVRRRGAEITNNGRSSGSVHFMSLTDNLMTVISQGSARRGNNATYLPIDHGDIEEFLAIRSEGHAIQNLSFGVTITDEWMKDMIAGDPENRRIWAKVLQSRANTGYPYIFFTDTVNNNTVDVYKDKEMKIYHSNLCTEIALPNDPYESFVCCLASMNVLHFDKWKNTRAVKVLTRFLDTVITDFIEKSENITFLQRAASFASNHRALGLGWLGWHSYLQSKNIAFESMEAKFLNVEVAKKIQEDSHEASREMAKEFGVPDLLTGYGRRNTTLTAIAPTKSSAFILGQVSEGIEPFKSNFYIKDLAKGKFTVKNPYLEKLLEEKGYNTQETWDNIMKRAGSVQHLPFLDEHEKDVFKTSSEISQKEVIIQAAVRQKYIDQSQSLNLMIDPSIPVKEVNSLIIFAWEQGIKTLYYQQSVNAAQAFARELMTCKSCES